MRTIWEYLKNRPVIAKYAVLIAALLGLGLLLSNSTAMADHSAKDIQTAAAAYEPGVILVEFASYATRDAIEETNLRHVVREWDQIRELDVYRLTLAPTQGVWTMAQAYQDLLLVEYAEPNYYIYLDETVPNDPSYPDQWTLTKIQASFTWDVTQGSPNTVIAIVDTGVDLDHPDLVSKDHTEKASNNVTPSLVREPGEVSISGPLTGTINTAHIFTATVSPVTATVPITYTWQATGQAPVTHTSGLNDMVTFTWSTIGTKTITVTANNTDGVGTMTYKHTAVPLFEDSGIVLHAVWQGSAAWGDYDNDSDLDIILTDGSVPTTKIYRNDGNNIFTDINATLEGVNGGSVAWGDYDNDGDLDVLLTGSNTYNLPISKVYRNDENGVFTDINVTLTGVWSSSVVVWGDYDNDGDLDIFLAGYDRAYNKVAKIYQNDGGGDFIDINAAVLQDVSVHSMAWGDYDNDSDVDILLTGWMSGTQISKIYRNDEGGNFTDINATLQPVNQSSAAWGDYDNDGDLDILLAGWSGSLFEVTRIYRNDGGSIFTDINAALTNVARGPSTAWGDYDNDGDLDILLRGCVVWDNGLGACFLSTTEIYRNDGNGTFTDINETLPDTWNQPVIWGDYDNDGDLDILVTGAVTTIYRNNSIIANTVPSTPTSLTTSITGKSLTLSWNAANDAQTPAPGLTYNLRVGTTPGGTQVAAPMATSSGYRQVPQLGNANHGLTATLQNLSPGTYYWSVQAIDTAFAGSPFASESSFTIWKAFLPVALRTRTQW